MTSFLIALAVLIGGYFIYGAFVEKVFGIDANRKTPAYTMTDGVDYTPMPTWRVFLIQFLNIAGLGPIFGAIMGAMFGPSAFLWIVLGTIFAGGVHDYVSGMMSIRDKGYSMPECVGRELGLPIKQFIRVFSVVLLLLVAAVFVITPAGLLEGMTPMSKFTWIAIIFFYYILATLLPVDKVIGKIYPIFGVALLFMALGILAAIIIGGYEIPDGFSEGIYNRHAEPETYPIFPMMFVSIACGAISGFHATQSPMMARCLKNERLARPVFYGAMVAEGIVALIWAAAAIAFTGGYEQLAEYFSDGKGAGALVNDISVGWLGIFGGALAMIGVIVAPITSGDTALRSARLIAADMLHINQANIVKRLLTSLPLFAITFFIMLIDFDVLWRYFAWSNQTLAMFTLWAATVYLARHRRFYLITLVPAVFMTVVCITYLMFAPECFALSSNLSLVCGGVVAAITLGLFCIYICRLRSGKALYSDND